MAGKELLEKEVGSPSIRGLRYPGTDRFHNKVRPYQIVPWHIDDKSVTLRLVYVRIPFLKNEHLTVQRFVEVGVGAGMASQETCKSRLPIQPSK